MYNLGEDGDGLGKAKVLAAGCHGGVERFAEVFVGFVLGEIELCYDVSTCKR
jgi:hypothetical protein